MGDCVEEEGCDLGGCVEEEGGDLGGLPEEDVCVAIWAAWLKKMCGCCV